MTIAPGGRLGPYEIVSRIGAGGMGEVWKARDTRIDRIVAIKTSHDRFTDRFAQEVRAIAALNHPHICTLYDVGPDYLVMEYVEGSEIKGQLPLDQTLRYAIQLASALEAAHRKGITHRDLKPANILVTKVGIKVLDFGLAKFEQSKAAVANDETLTRALTQEGSIVGTLQYMAPEQLQGKATDARADFFSFGCVLYEMLTGKRAFDGTNTASLIAAIMEREPPSMGAVAPASLDWLVRRCLAKDPDERWQTARDLRAALERVEVITIEAHVVKPSRLPMLGWGVAALLAIVATLVSFLYFRQAPVEMPLTRLSVSPPPGGRFANGSGTGTPPAISPDGRQIVFEAISAEGQHQLWLRPLDSVTAQLLPGTEAGAYPFWSPDSKSIGFFSAGALKRIDISGGPAMTLADAKNPRGGTWSRDGVIVFAPGPNSGLMQIPAAGGAVQLVTKSERKPGSIRFPWFLPDGKQFLYLQGIAGKPTIRIGSLNSSTEDRTVDGDVDRFAVYSSGYVLFVRGSTLEARPFDVKRLEFTGAAVPVTEQVQVNMGGILGVSSFSVSANGVLIYQKGMRNLRLTWQDGAGKRLSTVGETSIIGPPRLSPDTKTAAVVVSDANNDDIWLYDTSSGVRARFTFDPAREGAPTWSPDGRTIVFLSNRAGPSDIYRKPADGSGNEELLYADNLLKFPDSFSPDGRFLAYTAQGDPKTGNDIWVLPDPLKLPGAMKPYAFMRTEFNEGNAQFSPNGRWMAYQSDETNTREVYVAPFPGPGGKRQVSTAGGVTPHWRPDGKELFYISPNNYLMAAEVDTNGAAFLVKSVGQLFGPLALPSISAPSFDVSADGQRFLSPLPPEGEIPEPLTVVQNWTAGLKK